LTAAQLPLHSHYSLHQSCPCVCELVCCDGAGEQQPDKNLYCRPTRVTSAASTVIQCMLVCGFITSALALDRTRYYRRTVLHHCTPDIRLVYCYRTHRLARFLVVSFFSRTINYRKRWYQPVVLELLYGV